MIDVKYLKKKNVSSAAYKPIFTTPITQLPTLTRKLIDTLSNRQKDGYQNCLRDHRAYYAIDLAYETPFAQTTPTFINHLLAQHLSFEDTVKEMEALGLKNEELFLKVPMADGQVGLQLNAPVFYQIFVPIVKSYCTVRLAKIFNERNLSPLLQYNPRILTQRNMVLCEIITTLIETLSTWMGYPAVLRQSIQQMLKYGLSVAFPREEWYCEKQENEDGTQTVKEGIRYTHPHPTRMAVDPRFPMTSLNTNTGCEWAFYWHVMTYGDILDNRMYWNRKQIFSGTNWFGHPLAMNYFKEVYPCVMNHPVSYSTAQQREDQVVYGTNDRDKAVFVTEHFMRLIPKQWGLGDYKYPVWHRFTLAGDDTVLWAAPCAYNPTWFMGYDYDEMTARSSSMALELIPWQDHIGNLLSQIILTAKQNLANFTFYDVNMVDPKEIDKIRNLGEQRYRSHQFIPYDSLKITRGGVTTKEAFSPVQLTKQSIVELLQTLPVALNLMERVLQISAQEAGAAASHQQSKAEIVQTGSAGTNRVAFTCSFVDEGIDAWKQQLYDATMAYKDTSFMAQVAVTIPNVHKILEELGFRFEHRPEEEKLLVHGKKTGLKLTGFAATNQGPDRAKSGEVAQIIFQAVGAIAANPLLVQEVGAKNLITLLEEGVKLAGGPKDFTLTPVSTDQKGGGITPAIAQAIQQAQQATLQAVQEKVGKPAAEAVAQGQQEIAQIQAVIQKLQTIYDVAAKAQEKTAIAAQDAAAKEQIRQAEFAAEQRRKEEAHQQELRQEAEKAALEAQVKVAESAVKQEVIAKEAKAKAEAKPTTKKE